MSRPAARPILTTAVVTILAAGMLVAAWTTCLSVATSSAAAPDSPPFLGMTYLEMTAQAAAHHPGCVEGALVTAVKPGGTAALAGLRAGDTIIGMDGRPLGGEWTLIQGLLNRQTDAEMMVIVRRGDLTIGLPITLAIQP